MQQLQKFEISSDFQPTGDQPEAIDSLVQGVDRKKIQTLLGVTGSGKTFTVANVIARTGKNTLVISHNKTLAAQLYAELITSLKAIFLKLIPILKKTLK